MNSERQVTCMMHNVPVLITYEAEQYEFSGGRQEEYRLNSTPSRWMMASQWDTQG